MEEPSRTELIGSDQIVCLECPSECILTVSGGGVSGGDCPNGKVFAARELASPDRYLTATIGISGPSGAPGPSGASKVKRLPVRTDRPIPISDFKAVMSALKGVTADPDAKAGQTIVQDICGTGANIIATRTLSPTP